MRQGKWISTENVVDKGEQIINLAEYMSKSNSIESEGGHSR